MALDYGKMEFAVSFKPITAFPLDSRSYYESLAAAEAAAASAVEAGSDQGTIYFGQTFVVVENGVAQMLQVQPDGTLSEIGGKIEIDETQFAIDEESGKLSLLGFADAVAGAQPIVKEVEVEGVKVKQLVWQKPDTTIVDGLSQAIENLETTQGELADKVDAIENVIGAPATDNEVASGLYAELDKKADTSNVYNKTEVDNLVDDLEKSLVDKANSADVYNKTEVYTKSETDTAIATAVSAADHLKRKLVEKYDDIQTYIDGHDDADQYIFMVPTVYVYTSESNKYDEYIVLKSTEEDNTIVYTIEPVGTWAVDLADYVSETELADYLKTYYTQEQVNKLLEAYATTATLESKLEKYYTIEQLSAVLDGYYADDEIDALLANIYNKTEIDTKFDDYYTKTEVNDLLDDKVSKEEGKSLVSDTEIAKLATVEENAEENFIKSVTERFNVSENGQLSFNPLSVNDIEGLETALGNKVDKVIYNVPVYDENGNPVYEEDGVTPKTEQVEGTLLSPEDQEKLAALVIGDEGVQISGKVNADNVEGLATWITNNRATVSGLFSAEDETKLDNIEAGAQKNFITAVEDSQFTVTNGKLAFADAFNQQMSNLTNASTLQANKIVNLENIVNGYTDDEGNSVEGLVSVVNNFASTYVALSDFNSVVGDLNQMKSQSVNLWSDVKEIQEALKWQTMTE